MPKRPVRIAPRARRDFTAIVEWYRGRQGPRAAVRVAQSLEKGVRQVATVDLSAASRFDLPEGVFRILARRHLILFIMRGETALVVRMVHAARDLAEALREE